MTVPGLVPLPCSTRLSIMPGKKYPARSVNGFCGWRSTGSGSTRRRTPARTLWGGSWASVPRHYASRSCRRSDAELDLARAAGPVGVRAPLRSLPHNQPTPAAAGRGKGGPQAQPEGPRSALPPTKAAGMLRRCGEGGSPAVGAVLPGQLTSSRRTR